MYVFIAIILIAEFIIASTVICHIRKLDRKVCELCDEITLAKPVLQNGLTVFSGATSKLVKSVEDIINFAKIKREQYIISMTKNLLIYFLLFMLKGKSKKYVSAVQLAVTLKDCWDKSTELL